MVDLVCYSADLLFFDIPFLYYYINLNSSIICCFSSGDMYLLLFLFHFLSYFVVSSLKFLLFYLQFYFQLNHLLLLVFFEVIFWCCCKFICGRLFSMIKGFLAIISGYVFIKVFTHIFSKKKFIAFHKYSSLGSIE